MLPCGVDVVGSENGDVAERTTGRERKPALRARAPLVESAHGAGARWDCCTVEAAAFPNEAREASSAPGAEVPLHRHQGLVLGQHAVTAAASGLLPGGNAVLPHTLRRGACLPCVKGRAGAVEKRRWPHTRSAIVAQSSVG